MIDVCILARPAIDFGTRRCRRNLCSLFRGRRMHMCLLADHGILPRLAASSRLRIAFQALHELYRDHPKPTRPFDPEATQRVA